MFIAKKGQKIDVPDYAKEAKKAVTKKEPRTGRRKHELTKKVDLWLRRIAKKGINTKALITKHKATRWKGINGYTTKQLSGYISELAQFYYTL